MQDRVSLYPGRVTLTPVSGQANTYDLTRADQPTQEGTPLNKSTLLKDATAALYGLGTDAAPDDALRLLSRFQSGLGNEYIWAKSQYQSVKTSNYLQFMGTQTSSLSCSDQITIDSSGNISISNPKSYTFTQIQNNPSIMKGKYVFYHPDSSHGDDKVKYIDETADIKFSVGGDAFNILVNSGGYIVSSQLELVSYVNSPYPDAYPPAVSDGYTYTLMGQLGDKTRIATGSYTGTGTYGASNPNSLTFGFVPKLVIISSKSLTIGYGSTITQPDWKLWIGQPNAYVGYNNGNVKDTYKVEGNKFSWYNSDYGSATMQLNYSGQTYYYIAIG